MIVESIYLKFCKYLTKCLLCVDIVWVQVPPRSLIDSFHREGQLHLLALDLKRTWGTELRSCRLFRVCMCVRVCACVSIVTSLPMTLIHTCSPTSTISEALSTRVADISLTCTRPVWKSTDVSLKTTGNVD